MARDRFFEVPRSTAQTSAGQVDLPILYFEVSNVVAYTAMDASAARALLEDTPWRPVLLPTGHAVGGISFYAYRRTSIGPYHEVGVALAVTPRSAEPLRLPLLDLVTPSVRRTVGFHVLDLPVTTEIANAAGRELWGLPKFVTDLPFRLEAGRLGGRFEGRVADPDGGPDIVRLSGRLLPGLPAPGLDLVLYSRRDDAPLRTVVDVSAPSRLAAGAGLRLTVGASAHPMARRLRRLGVEGRPLLVQYTDRFRSRLNAGVVVG